MHTAAVTLLTGTLLAGCAGQTPPEVDDMVSPGVAWVACSRLMVVGDVTAVREATAADDQVDLTLAVQDWLKPSHGDKTIDVQVVDPSANGGRRLASGDRVLATVNDETGYARTYGGKGVPRMIETIKDVLRAVPAECPPDERVRGDV